MARESRRRALQRMGTAAAGAFVAREALAFPADSSRRSSQAAGETACAPLAGKSVRWVVPYTAGGGYDVYARLIAPYLARELQAEIMVDNVPGASGTIGARTVQGAPPDGTTIGILHAAGLLVASMSESTNAPHPVRDFTVLGRVAVNHTVWVTSARARHRTLESMAAAGPDDPVIMGATEVSSSNFVAMAVAAELLSISVEFVAGQPGSRESSLALIRGEVDAQAFTLESILDRIDAGDLIPVLQISADPGVESAALQGVPALSGPDGIAARWARERGDDMDAALGLADALARLMALGRIVAAPPGMDPALAGCLGSSLLRALADPEFRARAAAVRRRLDVLPGAEAAAMIGAAVDDVAPIVAIVSAAIDRLRG